MLPKKSALEVLTDFNFKTYINSSELATSISFDTTKKQLIYVIKIGNTELYKASLSFGEDVSYETIKTIFGVPSKSEVVALFKSTLKDKATIKAMISLIKTLVQESEQSKAFVKDLTSTSMQWIKSNKVKIGNLSLAKLLKKTFAFDLIVVSESSDSEINFPIEFTLTSDDATDDTEE